MNITSNFRLKTPVITSIICALLSSCSSGDSNNTTSGRGGVANGILSLDITDAPVDEAKELWVEITGVTLHLSDEDQDSEDEEDDDEDENSRKQFSNLVHQSTDDKQNFTFYFTPPKRINLLQLQGTRVESLLENIIIPAGTYNWIRLSVNASKDDIYDSYIKLNSGEVFELDIPGGSESGLKLNQKFNLILNTPINYTIDFDLRRSVILTTPGEYILKPVLRLVENSGTNSITGTVNPSLLLDSSCSDLDPLTNNAIYLFENSDSVPNDINSQPDDPISSALVNFNIRTGNFEYTLGFIPTGNYTIAFTCQSDLDKSDTDENIIFIGTSNISLVNSQNFSFNF